MKKGPLFLWHLSVTFFVIGLWLTVQPAYAGSGSDNQSFTWGQVCVLVAVASAWGDSRARQKVNEERWAELRDELHELRRDMDRIKTP